MRLLKELGADPDNIFMVDRKGVLRRERQDLNVYKREFAIDTDRVTLADAMRGADVFIGVSGPDLVTAQMLTSMADHPIVFALSNPDPEISPALAHQVRADLIMATGRSDYPNQVNNVLGFPFIFRGALDVRARTVNTEMQKAAVAGLRALTHEPVLPEILQAYRLQQLEFGPDYIIPKPFDPRLMDFVPPAVAQAAVDSGVARCAFPQHYKPAPHLTRAVAQ
jgi:malate dehydrogenase (oxaloacetate-decarboxylating)(NADP+)